MGGFEHNLRTVAQDGVRIHIWKRRGGGYQVNVSEPGNGAWTVVHDDDPITGLGDALRQRVGGSASRTVASDDGWRPPADCEPEQLEIEAHIQRIDSSSDMDDLLG